MRVTGTPDFELQHEILQPDDSVDHFSVSVRRNIGLVRLGGGDRNDRDLRLIQGSALERLLSDKTLRSRLGNKLAQTDVEGELKDGAKDALAALDKRFGERALPSDLSLGLVGGPGFSLNALIGLTAAKDGALLPLSSWGAGTRRLAALEVAAAHTVDHPIMVVDEIERGLESYRQRLLMEELIAGPSQVFVTTHMAQRIDRAARRARETAEGQMHRAEERFDKAAYELRGTISTLRAAHEQRRRRIWAAVGGVIAGCLLWSILPGAVARALPERWHLPEKMATHIVGAPSVWEGGMRLMQAGSPEAWRAISAAAEMRRENKQKIAGCELAATKAKNPVRCTIKVGISGD